jgi:hypothetical protein
VTLMAESGAVFVWHSSLHQSRIRRHPMEPAFPCGVSGWHRYYTSAELKSLYGDHGNYVAQVTQAMVKASSDGYVLPVDALAAISDAENSEVAK